MTFDERIELGHVVQEIKFGVSDIEVNGNMLSFRIPEGEIISISLSRAGFHIIGQAYSTCYESIEALLFQISPKFKEKFHSRLYAALSD